eukprot:3024400-Amphidinium_carterae.1
MLVSIVVGLDVARDPAVPDDEEHLLQSAGSSTDKPPERTGAGGQLIAATYTLADRVVRDSSALMVCLVRPLRRWHLSLVCQLRSPEGCAEHVIGAACGSWYSMMHELWAVLQDEPSLRAMGFVTERAEIDAARLDSSHSCRLAETAFTLCRALVGVWCARNMAQSMNLPGLLAALLSAEVEV